VLVRQYLIKKKYYYPPVIRTPSVTTQNKCLQILAPKHTLTLSLLGTRNLEFIDLGQTDQYHLECAQKNIKFRFVMKLLPQQF